MVRFVVGAAFSAIVMLAAAPGLAQDAAKVKQAAEQFDAGVAAYKQKDFEGAGARFEAADAAVPSPKSLRQAIRARVEGGQGSRGATLAAQALDRYPGDDATVKLAKETLEKLEPLLQKVNVSCAAPCVLASGTRSIPGEANTRWVVYFDPGQVELNASFVGAGGSSTKKLAAKAGEASDVRFDLEEKKPVVVVVPPVKKDPDPPIVQPDTTGSGLSPAVFVVGMIATAGVGGVTIWSGIDAKNNPGPDVVRQQCAGKGEGCPAYQDGLARQQRTNILIGATAGTAGLTAIIGLFFTNWHGKKGTAKSASAFSSAPTAVFTEQGATFGARGAF